MPSIRIEGYENLNKVKMDKAIYCNTPYSLKDSIALTEQLLRNGEVEIEILSSFNVLTLLKDLRAANANVSFIK